MQDNKAEELGKIAFIVGTGGLAEQVISTAKINNLDFIVAGINGFSDKAIVNSHKHFWFYMGQVGDLIEKLKQNNIKSVVLAGAIKRPSLWALKLDNVGHKLLKEQFSKAKGDNSLLTLVIKTFEDNGFKVVSPQQIAPNILSDRKIYTKNNISEEYLEEIKEAVDIARKISVFDIGQSLVYQQNMVVAVEAVEGTSNMILRSKKLLKKHGRKGFLVKLKKLNQDVRVDLPTIGENTIKNLHKAGLAGVVIDAGNTIILNEEQTIKIANKYNIFVISI
jgi:DUF1009 family protein